MTPHSRAAELCLGPMDGQHVRVPLCRVEQQVLYLGTCQGHIVHAGTAELWTALEKLGRLAVYRLRCLPTPQGLLCFEFDGYLHAHATERT